MSKFSINFENEEQYRNFINSIKDEVIKEMPSKKKVNPSKNAMIWNYAKSLVEELELRSDEEHKLINAISVILRFGFKTRTVHLMPDSDFDKIKPYIDNLFESIISFRDFNRPPAYERHWRIKEESE